MDLHPAVQRVLDETASVLDTASERDLMQALIS